MDGVRIKIWWETSQILSNIGFRTLYFWKILPKNNYAFDFLLTLPYVLFQTIIVNITIQVNPMAHLFSGTIPRMMSRYCFFVKSIWRKFSWNWFHEKFISFYFCIIIAIDVLYLEFDFEFISTNSFLLFSFEVKKLWRRNIRIQFYWFYHPTKKSKYTIAHFYLRISPF